MLWSVLGIIFLDV